MPSMLCLSRQPADAILLKSIIAQATRSQLEVASSSSLAAALSKLERRRAAVLLCEAEFNWRELPERLAELPSPPLLIVMSRLADRTALERGPEPRRVRHPGQAPGRNRGHQSDHPGLAALGGANEFAKHAQQQHGRRPALILEVA
jgi:hypothetical protein